ncbi:MAG: hypothetical protein KAS32_12000 [Candidatus Peribacteraceae bacterium]|nr:hypothetical protein [Candidatus Peribacteraceae bacterium]
MSATLFLASIFGPLYLVVCLSLLLNKNYFQTIFKQILDEENTMVLFYLSIASFVAGIFLVKIHNYWTNPVEVIVSLIGWCALVKGTFLLLFPGAFKSHLRYMTKPAIINVFLPIGLVLGAYLTGVAYF